MRSRLSGFLSLLLLLSTALYAQDTTPQLVRFRTNLGDIDVTLLPNAAPLNVANFLNYMNKGAFNNTVIHRSVHGFIFQGGGFQLQNHNLVTLPADAPVANEFKVSNTRGTLAMALLGSDPNSATTQWFFNEVDNSANLDFQNGGFTVFGRVLNDASLLVMDKIAGVPVPTPGPLPAPYDQIPLLNYTSGTPTDANYVIVQSITALVPFPAISTGGVVTATNFGGYPAAAAGSFIEIYGTNLAQSTRGWGGGDFSANGTAPTSLDGVSVTVGGIPAYVNFVSPSQVNVQVPAGVPSSGTVPVIVTYKEQASASVPLPMRPYEGGLLAPPAFKVGGTQYAAAVHANGSFVSNGKIPGAPLAPAKPGETLVFYGVGFGPVTPGSIPVAGQVVSGLNNVSTSLQFTIGTSPAQISYAGLVAGYVGLYQFNVTVPANAPNGDLPITVQLGAQTVPQTLYLTVQN